MAVQGQGAKNRQHTHRETSSVNPDNCPGEEKGKRLGMFEDEKEARSWGVLKRRKVVGDSGGKKTGSCGSHRSW